MKTCVLCLSCGRFDLLVPSISSFLKTYDKSDHYIIVDDSGDKEQQALIREWYPGWDIYFTHCGQAGALDKLIEEGLKIDSDYYILLEDDWNFTCSGWFEDSYRILNEYPEVMLIGTSLPEMLRKYMVPGKMLGIPIFWHYPWRIDEFHGYWNGWISQPRVMRRKDVELLPKFSNYLAEEVLDQQWWKLQYELGRRSIWLAIAYCEHIGEGRSKFSQGDMLSPEIRTWMKPFVGSV